MKLIREPKKEQQFLEWTIPLGTISIASINWLWWLEREPFRPILALFMVFALVAFAFETGYKKFMIYQQRVAYFILVFLCPLFLSVAGLLGGLLYARVV